PDTTVVMKCEIGRQAPSAEADDRNRPVEVAALGKNRPERHRRGGCVSRRADSVSWFVPQLIVAQIVGVRRTLRERGGSELVDQRCKRRTDPLRSFGCAKDCTVHSEGLLICTP